MKPVVAVEESLSDIADYLSGKGCEIRKVKNVGASKQDFEGCQAVIVSGMDKNTLGYQDIEVNVPVINAQGEDPATIWAHLKERTSGTIQF